MAGRRQSGKTFVWKTDKKDVRMTYHKWSLGNPTDVSSGMNCLAVIRKKLGTEWFDDHCDLRHGIVCE